MPVPQPPDGSRTVWQTVLASLGGILPMTGGAQSGAAIQGSAPPLDVPVSSGGSSTPAPAPPAPVLPDIGGIIGGIIGGGSSPAPAPAPAPQPSGGGSAGPQIIWTGPNGQPITPGMPGWVPGMNGQGNPWGRTF